MENRPCPSGTVQDYFASDEFGEKEMSILSCHPFAVPDESEFRRPLGRLVPLRTPPLNSGDDGAGVARLLRRPLPRVDAVQRRCGVCEDRLGRQRKASVDEEGKPGLAGLLVLRCVRVWDSMWQRRKSQIDMQASPDLEGNLGIPMVPS